jgi:hypothetical protein
MLATQSIINLSLASQSIGALCMARHSVRLFSAALIRKNLEDHTLKDIPDANKNYGSFKTFAEYREFIIRKDPDTLKARFNIMMSDGKPKKCPESEAENKFFGDKTKQIAYNL